MKKHDAGQNDARAAFKILDSGRGRTYVFSRKGQTFYGRRAIRSLSRTLAEAKTNLCWVTAEQQQLRNQWETIAARAEHRYAQNICRARGGGGGGAVRKRYRFVLTAVYRTGDRNPPPCTM